MSQNQNKPNQTDKTNRHQFSFSLAIGSVDMDGFWLRHMFKTELNWPMNTSSLEFAPSLKRNQKI